MTPRTIRYIARALWAAPLLMVLLTIQQGLAARDIRATLAQGTPAVAEVTEIEKSDRVDVTYDYVSLRVPFEGEVLTFEKLSLPHSLVLHIVGAETLAVRLMPGAAQPIVVERIASTQWRIAAMNALMAGFGALLASIAIFAWNRYLRREGDPAYVHVDSAKE